MERKTEANTSQLKISCLTWPGRVIGIIFFLLLNIDLISAAYPDSGEGYAIFLGLDVSVMLAKMSYEKDLANKYG